MNSNRFQELLKQFAEQSNYGKVFEHAEHSCVALSVETYCCVQAIMFFVECADHLLDVSERNQFISELYNALTVVDEAGGLIVYWPDIRHCDE